MSKHSDDEKRREEANRQAAKEKAGRHAQPQSQQGQPKDAKNQEQLRAEGERQAKQNEKNSPYGETPKVGSLDPGRTTMANPGPQNIPLDIPEPTDDPMATPAAAPLPNPPSRPGGDLAGEPNVSATGEKLDPDHPDYRKDMEGQHGPDHRTAEEKKAHPLDDKGQADNTRRGG